MEGYFPMKLKRKDLDEVNDDFCDFSLSSPARKIRRLDAELPPIVEEEEMGSPLVFEQSVPSQATSMEQVMTRSSVAINELNGSLPENEERAIVLYDPMNNIPSLQSRSPFSISVNSDFLSGYKSGSEPSKGSLAVVPWVAPPSHHRGNPEVGFPEASEMMDADDMEAITMDIEDANSQQFPRNEMNQWQQHCMIPEAPMNLSTPISWSASSLIIRTRNHVLMFGEPRGEFIAQEKAIARSCANIQMKEVVYRSRDVSEDVLQFIEYGSDDLLGRWPLTPPADRSMRPLSGALLIGPSTLRKDGNTDYR
ncbi:unnamed protein product [Lactuca saligna]|uniref:Uncharacterized protein n=1 Tax=Lactuca saligna TaxID=75948 RepID=A0AA35ZJN5_LACSI|nr:unnamed protein product [Lactuca saligna]